jgi:hypothetical protein
MPIQMDISRLHRLVMIVARGAVSAEEIRRKTDELAGADVVHFGKIVDVSGVSSVFTKGQVRRIAAALRKTPGSQGPVAFVVNPEAEGIARAFADILKCDRLIRLFRSIHDARRWAQPNAKG